MYVLLNPSAKLNEQDIANIRDFVHPEIYSHFNNMDYSFAYKHIVMFNSMLNSYTNYFPNEESTETCKQDILNIWKCTYDLLNNEFYFKVDEKNDVYLCNKSVWNGGHAARLRKHIIVEYLKGYMEKSIEKINFFSEIILDTITVYFKDSMFSYAKLEHFNYDMRLLNPIAKWQLRCMIFDAIKYSKKTQKEIALMYHVSERSVRNLYKKFKENNFLTYSDLMEKKHGPEKDFYKKIPEHIFHALLLALSKSPSLYKLKESSWTATAIQEFLKKEYGLELTLSYVYYFVHRMYLTSKVGKRCNPKQDKEEVRKFIYETYPALVQEALKNGEIILFGDETHVQQGYGIRSYAPKGKRSLIVYHQANRHTDRSLFTVIGLNGYYRIFCIPGTIDSGSFIDFLKTIKKDNPGKKILLFVDNCYIHKSKKLLKWLNDGRSNKGIIRVVWLPKYSPEINPVEYFNNYFKNELKKPAGCSSKDVIQSVYDFINDFDDMSNEKKEELIKSFFKGPGCLYTFETYIKFSEAS